MDKAKSDLEDWALRINEDCLRSWLLLAKVNYLNGNQTDFEENILEAKKRNPEDIDFIEGVKNLVLVIFKTVFIIILFAGYVKKISENSSNN